MTILLSAGIPAIAVRSLAAWKELLLGALFIATIANVIGSPNPPRLSWIDLLAFAWMLQVCVYWLAGGVFDSASTISSRSFAARDWFLYLCPYFIGRFTALPESSCKSILRALVWIGLITSIAGIIEYVFVPTSWQVSLGVPQYFSEVLGLDYSSYPSGLPPNYWAEVAGLPVRRAVSVYLSGQGFAIPFLLVWPAVLFAHFRLAIRNTKWIVWCCGLALLLTITRMTIVACFIQTLVVLLLCHRYRALLRIGIVTGVLLASALSFIPSFRDFVVDTIRLEDTSANARPNQWREGFRELANHPLGSGLTAVGQSSTQLGGGGIGQEAGYLKILNSLGVPGAILYLGWFAGVWQKSQVASARLENFQQILVSLCLVSTVGFLANNFAAPPDQAPVFIYTFCWLAGFSVQKAIDYSLVPAPTQLLTHNPIHGRASI